MSDLTIEKIVNYVENCFLAALEKEQGTQDDPNRATNKMFWSGRSAEACSILMWIHRETAGRYMKRSQQS